MMKHYTYSFNTHQPMADVFAHLLDVRRWWSGLYEEKITGSSQQLNDEFSFAAGAGIHESRQRLIELVPDVRIVWLVTMSKLTFLSDPTEWEGTRIRFDLSASGGGTHVTFVHEGLVPQLPCYDQCSNAWEQYLRKLEDSLNNK
ncbi:MAG: SRPBCC domain-containing protein [Cyclobacteriaceae bacterium]|nr:SRPBCC domain-containing protein [Cyclobacteriaceae bacterium]